MLAWHALLADLRHGLMNLIRAIPDGDFLAIACQALGHRGLRASLSDVVERDCAMASNWEATWSSPDDTYRRAFPSVCARGHSRGVCCSDPFEALAQGLHDDV